MTRRLATMCLVTMLLIGVAAPGIHGQQDTVVQRLTLKGISAVFVLIENLPDGAKALGLTRESIQTDVELKLRLAGIRVVTERESLKVPGGPTIYVRCNFTNSGVGSLVAVELRQDVNLVRNGQPAVFVTTWETDSIGVKLNAKDTRDTVKDLVDQFLNDWLAVNPKN